MALDGWLVMQVKWGYIGEALHHPYFIPNALLSVWLLANNINQLCCAYADILILNF